jgi:hypothetical protein
VKPFAPIDEKLSLNFFCIAVMAVLMHINDMIPNAMMATVSPVRSLFALTVLNASVMLSFRFNIV